MTKGLKIALVIIVLLIALFVASFAPIIWITPSAINPLAVKATAASEHWVACAVLGRVPILFSLADDRQIRLDGDAACPELISWSASPDFSWLATVTGQHDEYTPQKSGPHTLTVVQTDSGNEIGSYTYAGEITHASWSADGRRCALTASKGRVLLFDISPGAGLHLAADIDLSPMQLSRWDPPAILDANNLIVETVHDPQNLYHLTVQPVSTRPLASGMQPQAVSAGAVAFKTAANALVKQEIATGRQTTLIAHRGAYAGGWSTLSPDGQHVLYARPRKGWSGPIGLWVAKLDRSTVGPVINNGYGQVTSFSRNATNARIDNVLQYVVKRAAASRPHAASEPR